METPVRANTRTPVILCSLCQGQEGWGVGGVTRRSSELREAPAARQPDA